jgi:hypothetical protein
MYFFLGKKEEGVSSSSFFEGARELGELRLHV